MLRTPALPAALLALVATLVMPAAPAWSQKTVPAAERSGDRDAAIVVERQGPADDEVTLEISVEAWVETRTATVRMAADLAVEAGGFGVARAELVTALQGLDAGAEWRIVDFGKLGDDAGFERWRVVAEARVPEAAVAELGSKAKAATRPGRSLAVEAIDYTPTRAEREAVVERLRAEIYGQVAKEAAALNAAFPDRRFRVRMIDLAPGFRPEPRQMMATMRAEAAPKAADAAGWLAGSEKAVVTARVILAAAVE